MKVGKEEKPNIILGLDISTTTIGCALVLDDGSDYGKIIELTHVAPKVPTKLNHTIESLFIKKKIFEEEFLYKWKDKGITQVILEEPLLRSNNVNTVGTLLRFNGMVSDAVYNTLGIVPQYISSYDARKYAFPRLMSVRKFGKDGSPYPKVKILNALKKNQVVLFGEMQWDAMKKEVLQGIVADIFPDIEWLYDKKGELKKENFDAVDAYVCSLAYLNQKKYGDLDFKISDIKEENKNILNYKISYWNKTEERKLTLIENEKTEK